MQNNIFYLLPHSKLPLLISILGTEKFEIIGPQSIDGSIVYEKIENVDQLPWGILDYQWPGIYRLENTDINKAFIFTNGPQALKPYLFRAQELLFEVEKKENKNNKKKLNFIPAKEEAPKLAFIGARACDLAAMAIQDKIFLADTHLDIYYRSRRENLFIIAVNCIRSSANCFCASTGDGPKVTKLYDILMTEIEENFVVQVGTDNGKRIIDQLELSHALPEHIKEADEYVEQAGLQQTKKLPDTNLRNLLFSNLNHPRWNDVAKRCLSCTNCTQVCPTCFCHSSLEQAILDGTKSGHYRVWDSCFTCGHSYIHGRVIRDDTRKRYRQWLTHKLGSWYDQFGTSGCVGCGRCITWCPVGIDITEETYAIYDNQNNDKEIIKEIIK
ncbi:MAG: 4Fe-4S dicluster domain-containing protein [Oligoflexia bacterium]|nr:4Fe-4S dicluster domain-containing protein [Oligoflexia bacterium]